MNLLLNGIEYTSVNYKFVVKIVRAFKENPVFSFFWSRLRLVLGFFSSIRSTSAPTHKRSLYKELTLSYRQDTKPVNHTGQKPLFGANELFLQQEYLSKKEKAVI
jgi:hypothetical protein